MTNVETLEVDVMFVQMKEILRLLDDELLDKIPEKIKHYILNYKSKNNYKFIYDTSKRLDEQNLIDDTRRFIAYLDYYYFANDDEKLQIDKIWDEKELKEIANLNNNQEIKSNENIEKDVVEKINRIESENEEIVSSDINTQKDVNEEVQNISTVDNQAIDKPENTSNINQEDNNKLVVKKQGVFGKLISKIKAIFSKK